MDNACSLCDQVNLWRQGRNPFVIEEFRHSLWVVGPHQFYRGYSLLLFKDHVRDLHELEPSVHDALWGEVRIAAQAVVAAYQPWRMNYASLGNVVPHIHVHLFPRYESDPDHRQHPWHQAQEFDRHRLSEEQALEIAGRMRGCL